MFGELRALVRHILCEDAIDVVEVEARIRVKASRRTITDVITDLRGIQNVVTVSQMGAAIAVEDGKQRIIALIKFEAGDEMDLSMLEELIKEIPEVDMLTITAVDNQATRRVA